MRNANHQVIGIDHQRIMNETFIQNAATFGSIKAAYIPLSEMTIDRRYQRQPQSKISKIASSWDDDKCGFITVSYRKSDGKFAIVDGQNRYLAAQQIGKRSLPCHIMMNLNLEDEALEFANQDENKVKVNTTDKFIAQIVAKEPETLAIQEICNKYGVKIVVSTSNVRNGMQAVSTARNIYRMSGEMGLDWIFSIIDEAAWQDYPKAHGKVMMTALNFVYTYCKDVDIAREKLISLLNKTDPVHVIAKAQSEYYSDTQSVAASKFLSRCVNEESFLEN